MEKQRNNELFTLVKNFSIISNATIAIFDTQRKIITSYPHSSAPFCKVIRKNAKINEHCKECDIIGFSKCCTAKKPYLYHCHMGLVEIVAPIMFGDTLLGYIIIGQFTDIPDKKLIHKAVMESATKYLFDTTEALDNIDNIVYLSNEYTAALTQLIEMCANYIWLNNILQCNNTNLAHEIRLYISEHLTDNLSIDSLCSKFGISSSGLYQLFKKSFGCGVIQIVQEERIKKAKHLLRDSTLSVSDVASAVGILDANYFARMFKSNTGMTPREFKTSSVNVIS